MARKILLVLLVYFATSSLSLMALGLGEIKLKSGLNQPLDAEISLLSVRDETNEQLRGSLGSIADFDRSGIEKLYFLSKIRFETITKAGGAKVLHLTTKEAVKEPFLNFLVNLEWPNGRLLREYTILLDPPIFDEAPKRTITPAAAAPSRSQAKSTTPKAAVAKQQWQGDIYGPTSSNDTLWGIAAKVRPDSSVTMQQAMVTIFEANPDAFMRGNINNLKRGAEIKVPDSETFNQVSQRDALRMIAVHNENWKSGKKSTPVVVMDTSSKNSDSSSYKPKTTDSGRLSLSIDDTPADTGASSATDVLTEEENEILKQQNENLQEQTQTDAEKIEQLERLLELKNEQLASLQNSSDDMPTITESATDSNVEPAPTPVPVPAVEQQKEISIIDGVMSGVYNLYLGIAGAIVLLFLLVSVFRRKNQDVDYNSAISASNNKAASKITAVDPIDNLPNIADNILAGSDISDYEEPDIVVKDAADPLGEADIYIAYGKLEQAESLLLNALADNAEDVELNTKLLECYAEMDEQDKFEERVEILSSAMDSDSELKHFIEDLYQTAWPEGKMFANLADEYDDGTDDFDEQQDEDDEETEEFDEQLTIDDDLSDDDLDENLDALPSTQDVFGEDLADIDVEDIDIEDDDDEYDSDDDIDTQLDLARAYVEMGDFEGTREIIQEIMETGTKQQCKEAQVILDSIEK